MISSMFKKNFIAGAKTEVSGLEIPDANIATVRSSVHIPFRYKSLAICTHDVTMMMMWPSQKRSVVQGYDEERIVQSD
jgi:hypothetical protein